MLPPTYRCTRCGCEASASDATLVEAMGWLVPVVGRGEPSLACLCAACRRTASDAGPARWCGDAAAVAIS